MNAPILLNASSVRALLDPAELLESLRKAVAGYVPGQSLPMQRAHSPLPGDPPRSMMVVFPGFVDGIPAYTVKVNAKVPHLVPSVHGLVMLNDIATGEVLAVMDSIVITEVRTALVGALAVEALARKNVERVAVIGAGTQGRAQLRALMMVRQPTRVAVFDTDAERVARYREEMSNELALDIRVAPSIADAVADADVIITATWSTDPFLRADMVRPGVHITAVGADEPGKAEVDASILSRARFVCDDPTLARTMGALAGAALADMPIAASLGDVLSERQPGRQSEDEITVFGSVGLAYQDLAAAWIVYQNAVARGGATTFNFAR